MKTYWQDSEEFWFHGGQYIVEDADGLGENIIVPVHVMPDSEDYEKVKEEARVLAERIAALLTETKSV